MVGQASLHPAVHFLPVSHPHYQDEQRFIPNLIDGAVILPRPNADAIELFLRLHLLYSMRAWILFEAENVPVHFLADRRIEPTDFPFRGGSDLHAVSQDSVPQFPH